MNATTPPRQNPSNCRRNVLTKRECGLPRRSVLKFARCMWALVSSVSLALGCDRCESGPGSKPKVNDVLAWARYPLKDLGIPSIDHIESIEIEAHDSICDYRNVKLQLPKDDFAGFLAFFREYRQEMARFVDDGEIGTAVIYCNDEHRMMHRICWYTTLENGPLRFSVDGRRAIGIGISKCSINPALLIDEFVRDRVEGGYETRRGGIDE